jgi:serine/threonine protein kinase
MAAVIDQTVQLDVSVPADIQILEGIVPATFLQEVAATSCASDQDTQGHEEANEIADLTSVNNSGCPDLTQDTPTAEVVPERQYVDIQVGPQHFDLLKLIGEGAFGKVLLVRNRLDKTLYAMKVLSKKLLKKKNNTQYMKSERDILTKVAHPFIVSLYFAFQSESKLFLVMEFLSGGELFFHLRKKGIILEKEAKFYTAELVVAIEFLHNCGVIHRDLKPENVLLRRDGHISITDFGLGKSSDDNILLLFSLYRSSFRRVFLPILS